MLPTIIAAMLSITSYSSVKSALMPLVGLALLIDAVLVGAWYMIGSLLNNNTVKAAARSEGYQLIGTGIMVMAMLALLLVVGYMFFSVANSYTLLNTSTITGLCNGLHANSNLDALSSSTSLLISSGSFPGLCSIAGQAQSSSPSFTSMIDYPLAATGVVLANLTNQTATQLNDAFLVDGWLGFLSTMSPNINLCIAPGELIPIQCLIPVVPPLLTMKFSITPFAGLKMIYDGFGALGTLMITAVESFMAQLTITAIFLYAWPFLLFGGIILRAVFLTRRLGGLLIAFAVGGILFYPALFSIEYLALGNGLAGLMGYNSQQSSAPYTFAANSTPAAYGFNDIFTSNLTFIPASADPSNETPYLTNFYSLPSMSTVAQHDGCWPYQGKLTDAELAVIGYFLLPGTQVIAIIRGASPNSVPSFLDAPIDCSRDQSLNLLYDFVRIYGVDGIAAYFLPLINLLVVLTGIIGLSGVLGGDTALAGLSRLV